MKTLLYVTWRQFVNKFKKALKRPVTYLFLAFAVFYVLLMGFSLFAVVKNAKFNSAWGLVVTITAIIFFALPTSYLMYARRKGIIFRPSHSHFVFNAPISPKKILIFGALKNIFGDVIFGILIFVVGIMFFGVSVWKMLLIFCVWIIMTALQEMGIVILLYGNDNVSVEKMNVASKLIFAVLGVLVAFVAFYAWKFGISIESVKAFIDFPALQMIPLIGWNVAVYRMILLGPDMVNVICSSLYVLSTAGILLAAWKMPCTGGYFEEAAKFADEYQKIVQRKKKGVVSTGKEKYRKVKGSFKGSGARAIFQRQLLEYKKAKFFVFGYRDLICMILAVILSKSMGSMAESPQIAGFALLGILAYLIFCTSGYAGKWEKELENPYLFLIPEKPLKKMWYATLMEHVISLLDGTIISVILGISWHVPAWQIVSSILIYVLFQAAKMYMRIFALYVLGDHFGTQVRNIFRLLIQSSVMGIGIFIAIVIGITINASLVFPVLLIYSMMVTVGIMFLASMRFEVLEQLD